MAKDLILKKSIQVKASPSKVWDALIKPELIKEWLFGTHVISDWKVGSPILFTGEWQGKSYEDKGTILKFEANKIFQYSYWSNFSGLPDTKENYSIITFEVTPKDNETILTLTQSNFATETMYEHSNTNWNSTLDIMKKLIEK